MIRTAGLACGLASGQCCVVGGWREGEGELAEKSRVFPDDQAQQGMHSLHMCDNTNKDLAMDRQKKVYWKT